MEIKLVDKRSELLEILKIQQENHIELLNEESKRKNGFVTVKHSFEMIDKMNDKAGQVIAKIDDAVVGYALAMPKEFKDLIPILYPMFETFEKIVYRGKALSDSNYYVMGQICVRQGFRRIGLFSQLYKKHREVYSGDFDYCVTEVSSRNVPSMLAHKKIGFETIHTFNDDTDEWNILLWDWKTASGKTDPQIRT